ncbi:MAG: trypsin-like peptidase domain-containing protein [Clostridiaceae bacterium]|nr:trypsin-like peptidase domain-containing protein [Clostridiaceae bacterium]
MYDENNKNEFNYMNPDEHKEVPDKEESLGGQQAYQEIHQESQKEEQTEVNFVLQDGVKAEPANQEKMNEQAPQYQNQQTEFRQGAEQEAYQRYRQPERSGQPVQGMQTGRPNQSAQPGQAGLNSGPDRQADYYGQPQQNTNGYYQNPYASGPVYNQVPPQPKKTKKKHSMAGRIAGITAAALLFGTVSGAAMVGINVVSDQFFKESVPAETEPVTIGRAETEAEEPKNETIAQASQAIVTDVSAIVENAMPSVVAINNTMLYQANSWFGPTQTYEVPSSGSGIIVGQNDEELLIVTNNHVVADSNNLSVVFIDDQSVEATIKGTDADSDLAVVAVPLSSIPAETLSQISVAKIGDSDSLKVGQGVIAIGNALGYGQSVTVGYVSALNREVKTEESSTRTLLQTDAAINPGNSGGALLNMQGELIGINAAKYSSTEVEGMGYAIPISQATDIINELMNRKTRNAVEESKQGYLGIQGKNIDETAAREFGMPRGVYVYKILDDGAAAQSTLREKDIITKFDGQSIRSMTDLQDLLTYYEGGETVTLTVQSLADGQYAERSVDVTLGFRPQVGTSK